MTIVTALFGKPDLYAAVRALGQVDPQLTLAQILSALRAGDDGAQAILARLLSVDQGLLRSVLRPTASAQVIRDVLATTTPAPLFRPDPAQSPTTALLTAGQRADMPAFSDRAFDMWFAAQGVPYGLGLYGENRTVYQTDQFADAASPERRTVHLGIDVFAAAMTPVYAPLAGIARHVTYNADPLDYGNTLILEHDADGVPFYTLYGHLAGTLPGLVQVGDRVQPGQHIAHLGDWHENGGWAAHIHFQIMTDMLEQTGGNFFGVGHASLWDIWSDICIDPNLILRIAADKFAL